jgi:Leucine-rich repeat (LRR) protein
MDKTRVTFPDPNLEDAIRDTVGKSEGPIYTSDLEHLTVLDAVGSDISDLTGLEYCVNLYALYLYTNNISDISPLAGLNNLETLALTNNNISDISALAGLNNLQELGLQYNNISDISPLAKLTKLEWLDLAGNSVSDFSVLPFKFDQDGRFIWLANR